MDLKTISVEELPLVGPSYAKRLAKLEIETVWDLFHFVPTRFLDFSKNSRIDELQIDEVATIRGTIRSFVNTYTKTGKTMQIVTIEDKSGKIDAMWFNQIYLSRTFREGMEVSLAGKLTFIGRKRAIVAPEYEIINENQDQIHTGHLVPVYAETAGISSKWIRRKVYDAWKTFKDSFQEFLPEETRKKYDLIDFKEAIEGVHFPKNMDEFEKAKHRLAFNELLALHISNMQRRNKWNKNRTEKLDIKIQDTRKFIDRLPFQLTLSQTKVVHEILNDLQKDVPMNRLLEGDVGSGKTIVAAISAFSVFLASKKTVLMAPTQILAQQHHKTLQKLFKKTKVKIGIWTSANKDLNNFDILIGTHALLRGKVDLKNVGLFVIDEQHKFGVEQRNALVSKSTAPHVLTMTATPIPRTVALTFFGDLELSTLNELPSGRQKITTWVVPEIKRTGAYNWMETQMKKDECQIFVVCPLIEASETETMKDIKNVNTEYEKLARIFKNRKIGLMHGKLKTKEKDEVVRKFGNREIDVLVTTPVVEVGIDIPNATIMVIEAAERFGLASLHQLRGRVGRGAKKSYCLLMTESNSEKTQKRLKAMTKNLSGFELAELDLQMRGPGEIFGKKQSGYPELKIADWNDIETIKATRIVAENMLE